MELYSEIEVIEGFIKSEYVDGKINEDVAKELMRMLQELKEKLIQ